MSILSQSAVAVFTCVLSTQAVAQSGPFSGPFSNPFSGPFSGPSSLPSLAWVNWRESYGRTRGLGLVPGFVVHGFLTGNYYFTSGMSDWSVGGQLDLSYGIPVGDGQVGVGGYATGYGSHYGSDLQFDPYVYYQGNNFRVTLGHTEDAFDKIQPSFPTGHDFKSSIMYVFEPLVRLDAKFGDVRISTSYSDSGWLAAGGSYKIGDTRLYAALNHDLQGPGNLTIATVGATHRFNDQLKVMGGLTVNSLDDRGIRFGVRYKPTDRLGFSAQVDAWDSPFSSGSQTTLGVKYGLFNKTIAFADWHHEENTLGPNNDYTVIGIKSSF